MVGSILQNPRKINMIRLQGGQVERKAMRVRRAGGFVVITEISRLTTWLVGIPITECSTCNVHLQMEH